MDEIKTENVESVEDDERIISTIPKKYHFEEAPIVKVDGRVNRRPTLYTEARKKKILMALKAGSSEKHAAGYAGISLSTLRTWRARGAEGDEDSVGVDADMMLFEEACLHASANSALYLIKHIMEGAAKDPYVALKALPMLHPEEYSPHVVQKISNQVDGKVEHVHSTKQINLENATYEELEQLETIALRLEKGNAIDAEIINEE